MNLDALRAQLAQTAPLTDDDWQAFSDLLQPLQLTKGQVWVQPGQQGTHVGLVVQGLVRHYYDTPEQDVTRWIAVPGTFTAPLGSLVRQQPSLEGIQAIEDTTLLVFSYEQFVQVRHTRPLWQQFWLQNIEQHYLGMEERVFSLIALDAKARYDWLRRDYPDIFRLAPLQHLAAMIGISPQHLSRLRAQRD